METKSAAGQVVYEDFVPQHKTVKVEGINTLVIELPEFKKDQIRVHIDNFGKLRISGERRVSGNRWSRFHKEIQVPVDHDEFRAKFEDGHLYVNIFPEFPAIEDEKKVREKVLLNVIAAVVVLVALALYVTTKN